MSPLSWGHHAQPGRSQQNGPVREVPVSQLAAEVADPFVRHQVDPRLARRAWVYAGAVLVESEGHLPAGSGSIVTLLGPAGPLAELAAYVSGQIDPPWRVTVPSHSATVLPSVWEQLETWQWHWMLTATAPPEPDQAVEDLTDADEINAVLDAGAPGAHARPGSPGVEAWLGVRESGRLLATGALVRQPDGTGHLRAVTVLPAARGRGMGRDLSAVLTRRALAGGSGVATLGVYTDNDPAVAPYRGLGYEVVHTFTSGPISDRSRTTAVAPSR